MSKQTEKKRDLLIRVSSELFRERGYTNTSLEDIYNAAGCSRATFYHHFSGKEELLLSWSMVMDSKYEEWFNKQSLSDSSAINLLMGLSNVTFSSIEDNFDIDSLSAIYAYQVTSKDERYFNSNSRIYNVIIQNIMRSGQNKNEIREDISFVELSKQYNIILRGVVYDWCISYGFYSLKEFGIRSMNIFLPCFLAPACGNNISPSAQLIESDEKA